MVSHARQKPQPSHPASQGAGLHLSLQDLLALRHGPDPHRSRPATRRAGTLPAKPAGDGIDLRDIRAFVEGDDLRRIDANATARSGELHVRSFHEDRDDATLLVADLRSAMFWGTSGALRSVRAGRWLAAQGWRAVARGGTTALLLLGDGAPMTLPPGTGEDHFVMLLTALVTRHTATLDTLMNSHKHISNPPNPMQGIERIPGLAPRGAEIQIATSLDGLPEMESQLARLARRRRVTLALIADPLELDPPRRALALSNGHVSRRGRLAPRDFETPLARLSRAGIAARRITPDDPQ